MLNDFVFVCCVRRTICWEMSLVLGRRY